MCAFQKKILLFPKDIFNIISDLGCDFNIGFVSEINKIFLLLQLKVYRLYINLTVQSIGTYLRLSCSELVLAERTTI